MKVSVSHHGSCCQRPKRKLARNIVTSGKGKLVDQIVQQGVDICCRFNGGYAPMQAMLVTTLIMIAAPTLDTQLSLKTARNSPHISCRLVF
jgi:hypothetical protein